MNVNDEALFLRASNNLFKLSAALLLSGAVLGYFGFIYFGTDANGQGDILLALRIGTLKSTKANDASLVRMQLQAELSKTLPQGRQEGLRFAIREGGRTIGAGVVSEIFE